MGSPTRRPIRRLCAPSHRDSQTENPQRPDPLNPVPIPRLPREYAANPWDHTRNWRCTTRQWSTLQTPSSQCGRRSCLADAVDPCCGNGNLGVVGVGLGGDVCVRVERGVDRGSRGAGGRGWCHHARHDHCGRRRHHPRRVAWHLAAGHVRRLALLNRPGFCGDSEPTEGWSHASTEEVSRRVA